MGSARAVDVRTKPPPELVAANAGLNRARLALGHAAVPHGGAAAVESPRAAGVNGVAAAAQPVMTYEAQRMRWLRGGRNPKRSHIRALSAAKFNGSE